MVYTLILYLCTHTLTHIYTHILYSHCTHTQLVNKGIFMVSLISNKYTVKGVIQSQAGASKGFETLQNVLLMIIVTKNIQSILLTAVLAIILIYLYSILGYMFFSNDFMIATNPMEHSYFIDLRKIGVSECDAGKD